METSEVKNDWTDERIRECYGDVGNWGRVNQLVALAAIEEQGPRGIEKKTEETE